MRNVVRFGLAGAALAMLAWTAVPAAADLSDEFKSAGFQTVREEGVSGLISSYYSGTKAGTLLPDDLFELGGSSGSTRVCYPNSIGAVPSPGPYAPAVARSFDEGALGVKMEGDNLIVKVAGGLDPTDGYYYDGWATWYSQGDVFITVDDSSPGVEHFALLNAWPRDPCGVPRVLNGGHFDDASTFHTQGGEGGTSLEGHLIRLFDNGHVVTVGGTGSYHPDYIAPAEGLDYRVFAQGGTDLCDAGLVFGSTTDPGYGGVDQTWYVQTWTVPLAWLSADTAFDIGLHKAASCGNDQIGLVTDVYRPTPVPIPTPSAVVLGAFGLGTLLVGALRRSARRRSATAPSETNAHQPEHD